jgi:hypothetical protein
VAAAIDTLRAAFRSSLPSALANCPCSHR